MIVNGDEIKPYAILVRANLVGAALRGANLKYANLVRANLVGANLEGATLKGANLKGANLKGANLKDASLEGANLEDASLVYANLKGANLEGAKGYIVGPQRSDGYRFDIRLVKGSWVVVAGCRTQNKWTTTQYREHVETYTCQRKKLETLAILKYLDFMVKETNK